MGRTWLLRGSAVAVVAVLVGAWALGLAELGEAPSAPANVTTPVSPDNSRNPDAQRSAGPEKAKPRRNRDGASPSESSPSTVVEPAADVPGTEAPPSSTHTPSPTDPSGQPSNPPPPTHPPTHPPSNPPSQPSDDCDDLTEVLDCVLNPVTGRP